MTEERFVAVTGTSRGLGRALAIHLAKAGYRVLAGVRRPEDAPELDSRPDAITPLVMDVTSASEIASAAEGAAATVGARGLHALVLNAGQTTLGPLELTDPDELDQLFSVNVTGPLRVVQSFLPMIRAARGHVVFIGGVMGHSAFPLAGAGCATKFALEAVADSLRIELEPEVHVTIVDPASIATGARAVSRARLDGLLASLSHEEHARYGPALGQLRTMLDQSDADSITPESVAALVVRIVESEHPKPRYWIGNHASATRWLERLPTRLRDSIVRRMVFGAAGASASHDDAELARTENV